MNEFDTKFDGVPSFWGSLTSLNQYDLLAELIQNDIDQNATRTVISFKPEQLICEGNGQPVDANGWQRLLIIQGAGDQVEAKQGKIGVKNHGLKAAFTIGDEIRILSDGHYVIQTLYAKGKGAPPYPGTSQEPKPNPEAPTQGCRIEIEYRRKILDPREGEQITLSAIEDEAIDELFKSACRFIPEQFAGVVSPKGVSQYEISLHHHRLGDAHFVFSATRPKQILKDIQIFQRKCEIQGSFEDLPSGFREEAAHRLLPLKGRLEKRVPDFYRRKGHFFVEVSWPIDGRSKPRQKGIGKFRYPIGYPEGLQEALTGHSVFFNAPIISDRERHGPAHNEESNAELRQHCEKLLVDVMAKWALPKWGPEAMNLLIPTGNDATVVRRLLGALIKKRSIPAVDWKDVVKRLVKGKHKKAVILLGKQFGRRNARQSRQYQFVIPTRDKKSIDDNLAIVCPPSERQLDPRVDNSIISLLSDEKTEGWCKTFITFDKNDAFNRLTANKNDYFSLSIALDEELKVPLIAKAYLDIIADSLDEKKFDSDKEDEIQAALLLPDTAGKVKSFKDLHTSAPLPLDIPGLQLPPILDPQLAQHRLLKRQSWRRHKYTMAKFLQEGELHNADEKTRHQFWLWLIKNKKDVNRQDRSKLADLPIWPDTRDKLRKLEELCEPRIPAVTEALGQTICRPHAQIHQSGLTTNKGKTSIRTLPNPEELMEWLNQKLPKFPIDEVADATIKIELDQFEADLATLLKNRDIGKKLGEISFNLPALAKDNFIRIRKQLLSPNKDIALLALPGRFVLASSKRIEILDKLLASLSEPTPEMMIAAFSEGHTNYQALQARLKKFIELTEEDDTHRQQILEIPIIPVKGRGHAPKELAIKGAKVDYWQNWKTKIPAKGLSQNDQKRYLDIGVTSAAPTPETSRAFFSWLADQDKEIIESHMQCVLRHILHQNGPARWAHLFKDIPAIPVRSANDIRLVSLRTATNKRNPVFLPDWNKFADKIMEVDPTVFFAIDSIKEIPQPASKQYQDLDILSLRTHIGEPVRVTAAGDISNASDDIKRRLTRLRSSQFRKDFKKSLNELDIKFDQVRDDWFDQISKINEIRTAKNVVAYYRFHNKTYDFPIDAGFDRESRIFWIREAQNTERRHFFDAIADQLIFKTSAPRVYYTSLERVLDVEIRDQNFPSLTTSSDEEGAQENVSDDEDIEDSEERETGEAVLGHAPFEPNPKRNIPNPAPLQNSVPPLMSNRPSGRSSHQGNMQHVGDQVPDLEKQHIEELKLKHYASHCQMCLGGEREPSALAPLGSYVEWQEVRKKIVEAHHVDLISGGGARHGGNLILLCKLHHDNFGRRLTREGVYNALHNNVEERNISFDENEIPGRIVKIVISDTNETVHLWFTREHADYWLMENT